jgi:hypothetical protein
MHLQFWASGLTLPQIIDTVELKEHPILKLPKAQQSLVWTLSSSVIGLISSLAEAQDEILEALSKTPVVINFMFGLLGFESLPDDLFVDVLHCLATLTEDNALLTNQIVDHESWLKGLMQLRELGGSKAVAACGVLHNIFSAMQWFDHNTPVEGTSDAILVPTLMQCVEEAQAKQELTNGPSHSNPEHILQLALEITASIATSLQEALEHANHNEKEFEGFSDDAEVSGKAMMEDDGSENDEEGEDASVSEETTDEEIDADMELVTGPDIEEEDGSTTSQPTLDALIRTAAPTILSVAQTSGSEDNVRASALSALNNIAWTVSSIDFSASRSSLSRLWAGYAQRIWSEIVSPVLGSNTADIRLASSITSIAWALARSVQGKLKLEGEEHRKFMALYQASKSLPTATNDHQNGSSGKLEVDNGDAFQGLGVKCIGVLGRLALHPAPNPLNREIGIFLLTVLSALPETPAADAVEALNQLFDIYADKAYIYDEPVFWEAGFYQHLEAIAPKARKMAKSIDKRKYTELRLRADEAVLNLGRFLTYKRREKTTS